MNGAAILPRLTLTAFIEVKIYCRELSYVKILVLFDRHLRSGFCICHLASCRGLNNNILKTCGLTGRQPY